MLNRTSYKEWPFTGPFLFSSINPGPAENCCHSGCPDCPYDQSGRINPDIPAEFNDAWEDVQDIDDDQSDQQFDQEEN